MKKILLATRSEGKLAEIRALFSGEEYEIISVNDVPELKGYEPKETAQTFEGNALIKAFFYGQRSGLPVLSEDSGIEVDALSGRPGVLSKRYAEGTDEDRYLKLLSELEGVKKEARGAQFRAVLAFYDPQSELVHTTEGVSRGVITTEPQGERGFGYDPVFYSEELGKTTAEATSEEKNTVSHRARAFERMQEFLKENVL